MPGRNLIMEAGRGEIRESVAGKEKRVMGGVAGITEEGFFTAMLNDPHRPHLMNKKSADLIGCHSKQMLLSSWRGEGREKEHTQHGSR